MIEKVLGFKQKDAIITDAPNIEIHPTKLIPVVSLEWLEKYFISVVPPKWAFEESYKQALKDLIIEAVKEARRGNK